VTLNIGTRNNQISAIVQVSGLHTAPSNFVRIIHNKPFQNKLSTVYFKRLIRGYYLSHKDGRNPGHLHSAVFDDQLVLQPQIIPYKEHNLSQLQRTIIAIDYKRS
jgi:hypothetical protein